MRKIIFRGKRKDYNVWVYGFYSYLFDEKANDYKHEIVFQHMESADMSYPYPSCHTIWAEVIPETVGQFTGLTDKNGKEIYEGDVIKFQKYSNYDDEHSNLKRHIAKVIFKEGCFCWDILKEGSQSDFHYSYKTEPLKNTCTTWGLEIIGNIHDNPELLT